MLFIEMYRRAKLLRFTLTYKTEQLKFISKDS